ncbi:MAG: cytochrome c oxidase subunit 4 [Micromonosporaceae bacterium]
MKTEYKIFGVVTIFLYAVTGLYFWWSGAVLGTTDWVGSVALLLSGTLTLMLGGYFWFVSRRIQPRPEDRDNAEISEGAGEVGFFSPGSYWPFALGLAVLTGGIGLAYWRGWLIFAGAVATLLASAGLVFEYYTGSRRGAEQ